MICIVDCTIDIELNRWILISYPRYLNWCCTRDVSNNRGVFDSFGLIHLMKCGVLEYRFVNKAPVNNNINYFDIFCKLNNAHEYDNSKLSLGNN